MWVMPHDEAVTVTLRLGLSTCIAHQCPCGSLLDAHEVHGFICKKAPWRTVRHHTLNDLVACSLVSAGIPASNEPSRVFQTDGKCPGGMTLDPWSGGKPLTWDSRLLATSYLDAAANSDFSGLMLRSLLTIRWWLRRLSFDAFWEPLWIFTHARN